MGKLDEVRQGQRIRVVLDTGDAFDVAVTRATHTAAFSLLDVKFADGVEGLPWTKQEGESLVRMGWTRSHLVTSLGEAA
jgi:hypothetical protein